MRIDASGNLGLGVTPSPWGTYKAFQVGGAGYGLMGGTTGTIFGSLVTNAYFDGSVWKYVNSSHAQRYDTASGEHRFFTAASGTAGNAITFTQAMTLDASGNLILNDTAKIGSSRLSMLINPSIENAFAIKTSSNGEIAAFRVLSSDNNEQGAINVNTSTQVMVLKTANAERARIDSSGNLLVGKTGTGIGTAGTVIGGGADLGYFSLSRTSSTNSDITLQVYSTGAAANRFYVGMGGTVFATSTTISAISDQRLKENIRDLDAGLAEVMALKPRLYDWKEGKGADIKNARGFIAQEFEEVFPDLIDEWRDPAPEGEEPYKSVRQDLIPVLVKAIQEQQQMIETLQAKVAALEAK
jgi:hypothetical protein